MAIVTTTLLKSVPGVVQGYYDVQGLVNGANAIVLPAPTLLGSFPSDWTPTEIWCFPYQTGAAGDLVTPDLSTIANDGTGQITFTLYSTGATNCRVMVW